MLPQLTPRDVERFWAKVDRSGGPESCWLWTAARRKNGYGKFGMRRLGWFHAHRIAYTIANGPIPDGLFCCHRCDNPSCVNPSHIFLGTHSDNMGDAWRKGRTAHGEILSAQRRGELNIKAKLTADDVRAIRRAYTTGEGWFGLPLLSDLASEYHVTPQSIWAIVHHKSWSHITD